MATLELLEERHFEAVTIADIAEEAGMAVGNFYKRFKNKEALLPHLYAEYNRRFSTFGAAFQQAATPDPWRHVVERTFDFFAANRGLIRALHLHSRLNQSLVPEGSTATRGGLYRALEPLVTRAGLNKDQREKCARMAALAMVSTLTEATVYPEMTPAAASNLKFEEVTEELIVLLKNYCC